MPKYNNIENIPAKTFFDILKSNNFQLLKPKPKENGLEAVFMDIYDEFFIKSDNHEAKRYLELTTEIAHLEFKIAMLKQCLAFYFYNQTTKEMRLEFIEALKVGYGIEIDTEKPFIEEVKRVLTIEIGIMQNDLVLLKSDFDTMTKRSKGKDFDYYETIIGIGNVLPNNNMVRSDITLAEYVALEKVAQKVIEQQKNKK